MSERSRRALVLGATGYVGGRLVPRLLEAGYDVRCLVRSPEKLRGLPWVDEVEVVQGDLGDRDGIVDAFANVDAVFHLVHSMGSGADFASKDRAITRHVARAAELSHVGRIVYMGGLGEVEEGTSEHLRSRAEVGDILLDATVPTTVLRAAVVIGSGSASFEMMRHLVERLPVMLVPRWVTTTTQPIAIGDVLRYLVGVAEDGSDADHVYDIGGPDRMAFLDMMNVFAEVTDLPKRLIVKMPFFTTPQLSSHWVNLTTPIPSWLARPLIGSLTTDTVVRDDGEDITAVVPGEPTSYRKAIEYAVTRISDRDVETSWMDAKLAGRTPADPYPGDPNWSGGTLLRDVRSTRVHAQPRFAFAAVSRLGGERGWPSLQWAWEVRRRIDRLAGGVGLRRGRRDPERLRIGDALDVWRVEDVSEDATAGEHLVRLRAEMWVPGRAWLEFRIAARGDGAELVQRVLYAPKGFLGRLYWWALLPMHPLIFTSMVKAIAKDAEQLAAQGDDRPGPGAELTSTDEPTAPPAGLVGQGGAPDDDQQHARTA